MPGQGNVVLKKRDYWKKVMELKTSSVRQMLYIKPSKSFRSLPLYRCFAHYLENFNLENESGPFRADFCYRRQLPTKEGAFKLYGGIIIHVS